MLEATGSLPFKSSPIMWSKLLYSSFSLSFNALDMTDMSSPGIVLDFKVFAGLHAKINAKPVANQDIQNPLYESKIELSIAYTKVRHSNSLHT